LRQDLHKIEKLVFSILAVVLVVFYTVSAVWVPAATQYHRGIYVLITFISVFLLYRSQTKAMRVVDYLCMTLSAAAVIYWIANFESINYRAGAETDLDKLIAVIGVLLESKSPAGRWVRFSLPSASSCSCMACLTSTFQSW